MYRVFQVDLHPVAMIYPRGLDAVGMYKVDGEDEVRSGEGRMNAGFRVKLRNLESAVIRIERV